MSFNDVLNSTAVRLLFSVALVLALALAAAFLVERSLAGALKGLRLALKAEFTTDAGRVNVVSIFLITFLMVFLKLHEIVADGLMNGHASGTGDRIIGPLIVIGLMYLGSIVCVMLLERKK